MAPRRRPYDVGVIGATGFTGRLVLQRLQSIHPDLHILTSSRKPDALKEFVQSLNTPAIVPWEHPVSSESYNSLIEFVSLVKVIITCAGPFFDIGLPVVRACLQQGTHYVDICAEIDFIRRIIDEFGAQARSDNILVVPACGFSSVADMGVFYAQQLSQSPIIRILNVASVKASMSGGSFKTLLSVANDNDRWRIIRDVYALNEHLDPVRVPGSEPSDYENDVFVLKYDRSSEKWNGPSATASINSRIVRRTASLSRLDSEHRLNLHPEFAYRELHECDSFLSAMVPATLAMLQSPVKWALSWPLVTRITEMLLPKAKEESGPDEATRKQNWFRFRFQAEDESHRKIRVDVHGGDFYDVSAETVAQAAVCILENKNDIIQRLHGGGVFTPAFSLGEKYLERLKTSTFLKFEHKQADEPAPGA